MLLPFLVQDLGMDNCTAFKRPYDSILQVWNMLTLVRKPHPS